MKETFDKAINFVLKHEGNYINNSKDPGGETKYGISKRSYPNEDIKNLTVDRAKEIYRRDYWDTCKCDDLPDPLDLIVFDTAINMGPGTALVFLDKSKQDWRTYLFLRMIRYRELARSNLKLKVFFGGWIIRVLDLFELIIKDE
jgi:lysozyme family protein